MKTDTFWRLPLRDIEHGACDCDRHYKMSSMIEPNEGKVDKINKDMKEFQLEEVWTKF